MSQRAYSGSVSIQGSWIPNRESKLEYTSNHMGLGIENRFVELSLISMILGLLVQLVSRSDP